MKRVFSLLLAGAFIFGMSCQSGQKKAADEPEEKAAVEETAGPNELTQEEKDQGWILLFDGKTTNGWHGYGKDSFPAAWEAVDGTLMCNGSGRGEAGAEDGGDIVTDQEYSNFNLKMEWKISEGGNSGIFYLGKEDPRFDKIYYTAPECQVLDNERHPDAMLGKDGNRQAGSLYDLIPADPQNAKPAGEWNTIEIICYKGTVVHKQNGETVLEYHLWTDDWNKLVADSKFPELNPDWADVAQSGVIALQDHGDDVWFRNIKIREL